MIQKAKIWSYDFFEKLDLDMNYERIRCNLGYFSFWNISICQYSKRLNK